MILYAKADAGRRRMLGQLHACRTSIYYTIINTILHIAYRYIIITRYYAFIFHVYYT